MVAHTVQSTGFRLPSSVSMRGKPLTGEVFHRCASGVCPGRLRFVRLAATASNIAAMRVCVNPQFRKSQNFTFDSGVLQAFSSGKSHKESPYIVLFCYKVGLRFADTPSHFLANSGFLQDSTLVPTQTQDRSRYDPNAKEERRKRKNRAPRSRRCFEKKPENSHRICRGFCLML